MAIGVDRKPHSSVPGALCGLSFALSRVQLGSGFV